MVAPLYGWRQWHFARHFLVFRCFFGLREFLAGMSARANIVPPNAARGVCMKRLALLYIPFSVSARPATFLPSRDLKTPNHSAAWAPR